MKVNFVGQLRFCFLFFLEGKPVYIKLIIKGLHNAVQVDKHSNKNLKLVYIMVKFHIPQQPNMSLRL